MANIQVDLQTRLFQKPYTLRALVASCSEQTHISRRLATKLKLLEDARDVFIKEMYMGSIRQWKLATRPLLIVCLLQSLYCFPLINMEENDAHYDMVIGADVWFKAPDMMNAACEKTNLQLKPTPGPAFSEDIHFLGHNIAMAPCRAIPVLDVFLEYAVDDSQTFSRLAFNHVTRQLVLMKKDDEQCFLFENITMEFEQTIEEELVNQNNVEDCIHEITTRWHANQQKISEFPSNTILVMA
jgi:hypothetical protein